MTRFTIDGVRGAALAGAFAMALVAQPAAAQKVHRCVDTKGNVTFSDKRCQTGDALRSPITAAPSPLAEPATSAAPSRVDTDDSLAKVAARLNERALR